jgi:hypothetical protein
MFNFLMSESRPLGDGISEHTHLTMFPLGADARQPASTLTKSEKTS